MKPFSLSKYLESRDFWGKTFKYDDRGGNTFDNDYAEKYFVMEADPEWDRVDYDKADQMIRGEFWQEGGARLYDVICKMVDAGQEDKVIIGKVLKAARGIESRVKDPRADGNLGAGTEELIKMYVNNAKQRHRR